MTLCNEPDTAEELMQETFLQAMNHPDSFRGTVPLFYQPRVTDVSLYAVMLPPVGSPVIRHRSLWSGTSLNNTVTDGGSVLIRCRDGCFAYDLRTLAALADASGDGTAHLMVGGMPNLPEEQSK